MTKYTTISIPTWDPNSTALINPSGGYTITTDTTAGFTPRSSNESDWIDGKAFSLPADVTPEYLYALILWNKESHNRYPHDSSIIDHIIHNKPLQDLEKLFSKGETELPIDKAKEHLDYYRNRFCIRVLSDNATDLVKGVYQFMSLGSVINNATYGFLIQLEDMYNYDKGVEKIVTENDIKNIDPDKPVDSNQLLTYIGKLTQRRRGSSLCTTLFFKNDQDNLIVHRVEKQNSLVMFVEAAFKQIGWIKVDLIGCRSSIVDTHLNVVGIRTDLIGWK